jgi:hypothetical protein
VRGRTHITEADDSLNIMDRNPEVFFITNLDNDILTVTMEIGFRSCHVEGVE